MNWARIRTEHGTLLPLVAALLFVAFLLVALLADIAMLHSVYRASAARADRIAEAGAAMIDADRLHEDGILELDPAAAERRALEAAGSDVAPAHSVVIDADTSVLCVEVVETYELRVLPVLGAPIEVRVRSCATPASG